MFKLNYFTIFTISLTFLSSSYSMEKSKKTPIQKTSTSQPTIEEIYNDSMKITNADQMKQDLLKNILNLNFIACEIHSAGYFFIKNFFQTLPLLSEYCDSIITTYNNLKKKLPEDSFLQIKKTLFTDKLQYDFMQSTISEISTPILETCPSPVSESLKKTIIDIGTNIIKKNLQNSEKFNYVEKELKNYFLTSNDQDDVPYKKNSENLFKNFHAIQNTFNTIIEKLLFLEYCHTVDHNDQNKQAAIIKFFHNVQYLKFTAISNHDVLISDFNNVNTDPILNEINQDQILILGEFIKEYNTAKKLDNTIKVEFEKIDGEFIALTNQEQYGKIKSEIKNQLFEEKITNVLEKKIISDFIGYFLYDEQSPLNDKEKEDFINNHSHKLNQEGNKNKIKQTITTILQKEKKNLETYNKAMQIIIDLEKHYASTPFEKKLILEYYDLYEKIDGNSTQLKDNIKKMFYNIQIMKYNSSNNPDEEKEAFFKVFQKQINEFQATKESIEKKIQEKKDARKQNKKNKKQINKNQMKEQDIKK